ncbi:MAG: pyridoxal-phosphate dependent enzyme [Ignavibacteria bacterium]|jgi:D-cysteine desulfhydrase
MIPQKLNIANIPTPIQKIKYNGCSFLIKRDDLTGVELSGNKIRKLEYLLYEAKKKKADYIFTSGGDQSNHCRASVIAAASVGIKSKIFLWGKDKALPDGNLFLNKVFGAEIDYLSKEEFFNIGKVIEKEKNKFEKKNLTVYDFPPGGSSELGIWGYINFIDEIKKQADLKNIKGLFSASGSGGTAAGLLVGSALHSLNTKIFAVNVLLSKNELQNYIEQLVEKCISKFRLKVKVDFSRLEILDGYSEEGYKKIKPEKIEVIKNFAKQTGILFDPAYTGKAFFAFNDLFLKNKKNSKIMFIHTGGLFGAFAKRKSYLRS